MAMDKEEMTIGEILVEQLHQPVLTTQVDPKDPKKKITANATDPRDGHELTAKEAIAMKLLQNALNGDIKAAQFIMDQEYRAQQLAAQKKRK